MGYRAYQIAVFLGILAQQMFAVAMGWLIYDRTGSALHLGYVGLAQFLPALLFAPIAGHLADRFSRSRLYFVSLLGMGLGAMASAFFCFLSGEGILPFYLVLIVLGQLRALEAPASSALLPQLVSSAELPSKIASVSSTKQIANVLGPALGGLAYAHLGGAMHVFALSASFACAAAIVMSTIPPIRSTSPAMRFTWENVAAGASYIRRNRLLLGAMSLDMFAVLFGGAVALLPVFARDILALGPEGLGWLRSAPAVGSLAMAAVLARKPIRENIGAKLFTAVFFFGVVTVIMGVSRSAWVTALALVLSGAANIVSVIIRQTLIQLHTPDNMRGRVSAVNQVFNLSSNQLGEFESGITAGWWGPVASVVFGGVATCFIAAAWAKGFPQLLRLKRFEDRHE